MGLGLIVLWSIHDEDIHRIGGVSRVYCVVATLPICKENMHSERMT